MNEWQPIETCPENTLVLIYASWEVPQFNTGSFLWVEEVEWEMVSESTHASGRRQIRQEKKTRRREWRHSVGEFWMPLPEPPVE